MAAILAVLTFVIVATLFLIPLVIGAGGKRQKIIRKRLESVDKARTA
jgi:hypothetical protein